MAGRVHGSSPAVTPPKPEAAPVPNLNGLGCIETIARRLRQHNVRCDRPPRPFPTERYSLQRKVICPRLTGKASLPPPNASVSASP